MAATNPIRVTYPASATGAQQALSVDWRDQVPSGYSYEVQFDGAAAGSVTVESTLDDINDTTITPVWIAETEAITADTRGVIAHPVVAVRINIGSLAGGALIFKLLGGSVLGDGSGLVAAGGGGGATGNVNISEIDGTPVETGGAAGVLALGGPVVPSSVHLLAASAANTNPTLVKNAPGHVHTVIAYNTNAAARYLKLYDKASAPVVGTDIPKMTIPLPPNAGAAIDLPPLYFATGIGFGLTTGADNGDSGAVGAGDVTGIDVIYV